MIKITVELCPFGDESKSKVIGLAKIWNTGTGNKTIGEYGYKIFKYGNPRNIWKEGIVTGFPRLKLTGWDLLYRVLKDSFGNRNK